MLGLESTVTIGKQSSAAAPATLARQELNVYSISGGLTEADEADNILGADLHNVSDPRAPAPSLDDHRLTVRVPLCIAQFGWWLAAFFGSETASGAPSDYTHLWASGGVLPDIFIEHQLKNGRYRRHHGLVGEQLDIDLSSEGGGFGMAELTFVGIGETAATEALAGTVTDAPALDRPAQKLVAAAYNSVSGGDLIGGKFSFKRTLKRVRGADGTGLPYKVEQNGIAELTGSLRARYNDDTHYADAAAKTARAHSLQLLRTAARGIKFDMANIRLSRTPTDVGGPDGVEVEYPFRAWQDVDTPALEVRVLNGSATVAFS